LDQGVAGRDQFDAVELAGEAFFVVRGGSDGETLAKPGDLFFAGAAAANLGTAAGCGHELSPAVR
jgi:hypothetical protein